MNSVHLSGRLTRDPELRHTTAGVPVAAFTLAVDRKFERDKADFINVTAWRKTAEFVSRYFKKGQRVTVAEGRIRVDQYSDKDGNKRTPRRGRGRRRGVCRRPARPGRRPRRKRGRPIRGTTLRRNGRRRRRRSSLEGLTFHTTRKGGNRHGRQDPGTDDPARL